MLVINEALAQGNSANLRNMRAQYRQINNHRAHRTLDSANTLMANAGVNPVDLYRDFDETTVREFYLDEGGEILSRLLPLGRSLPVGRMAREYTRSSDLGGFQTSMSGEIDVVYDTVEYDQDGCIIPVHQNGFKTSWREADQLSQEGFDDAVVKQEEGVREHRNGLMKYFMDGTDIVYRGRSWGGFRNDPRVDQIDLGVGPFSFDFTSQSATGEQVVEAWIALAERRYITQRIKAPACWFVSNEIWWNLQRDYSDQKGDKTILQRIMSIPGVKEVVPTDILVGNQILSMVLSPTYLELPVGMGISTIALPVNKYNDPLAFDVVCVAGIQLKLDRNNGNTAVQYAAGN